MKSNLFSLKLFCTQKKRKTIVSDLTQSIQLTMTYLANSSVTTIILWKLKRNSRSEIFLNYFPWQCHHSVNPCEVHSESWFPLRESCRCLNVRYFLSYYDVEGVDTRNQPKISTEVVRPVEDGPLSQFNGWARGEKIVLKGWRTQNLCRPLKRP